MKLDIKKNLTEPKKTFIIAEIGNNHNGSIELAKKMIDQAVQIGADCAKFQHFTSDGIVSDIGFKLLGEIGTHQSGWKEKQIFCLQNVIY